MNDDQLLRYSRHLLLPNVDVDGQEKILSGRVLIIGLGGLGSPLAMYLAAAGVGKLIISDDDQVEITNLQRQIIHTEKSLGQTKVDSAKNTIQSLNRDTDVELYNRRLSEEDLDKILPNVDVVVECSDNYTSRTMLNKKCLEYKKPLVSGAAIRFEGQLSVFDFRQEDSPCYQCLYDLHGDENLTCSQNGIFSPVVGIVGTSQALETLKILSGVGRPLVGKVGLFDGLSSQWRYFKLAKDPACKVCGSAD